MILRYVWVMVIGLVMISCENHPPQPVELTGSALGTTYSIKYFGGPADLSAETIHRQLQQVIDTVDGVMSVFIDTSQVSVFNRSASTNWFTVTPELFKVIEEAQEISQLSDGAFDISIGNLIELWGFGKTIRPDHIPPSDEISKALKASGYSKLKLLPLETAIRKTDPDLAINLSAIAKGYAVDAVASYLENTGINSFLVEIGGEVRTKGYKPVNKPWLVAIERPEINQRSIFKILNLSDNSMATSGDYRNFYEIAGKRYSHTIDPDTGYPVANQIASVSVIHSSCMVADALATTLMVLGFKKGFQFAQKGNYAVLWILRTDQGIREEVSPAFNLALVQ